MQDKKCGFSYPSKGAVRRLVATGGTVNLRRLGWKNVNSDEGMWFIIRE